MSVDEFYDVFSIVHSLQNGRSSSDLTYERNRIIRLLDSLGYCEFDYKRRKVYVCPPLLVGLPSISLPRALLTGARSRVFIQELKDVVKNSGGIARIILRQQTQSLLPAALIIESSAQGAIAEIAKKMNISYNLKIVAWELINFVAGIDNITPQFEEKQAPNWQSQTFSTTLLKFVRQEKDSEGVRLVEYSNPVTQQREHWLWRGTLAAEVDRDWGRYMSLAEHSINVLVHDRVHNTVLVPEQVPLPRLFARALTLSSGIAPTRIVLNDKSKFKLLSGIPMIIYSRVPTEVVDMLTKKLSQVPIISEITTK